MKGYPVLKEDIFYAKIYNDTKVKIRNTTTEKDFSPNPATVALLDLCTGARSVDEIVGILSERSGEPAADLTKDVTAILAVLQDKGIITIQQEPSPRTKLKRIPFAHPVEVAQIEITNKCNLSCLHCANDSGDVCPNELTLKEVLSAIDAVALLGVHQITLTGGEPFMHPDVFTIIEHARKAPMTVTIFTNGTLITKGHIKKCKELGVKGFVVSVDSLNENIHDHFRGQKGALKKTLNTIRLLKEAGFPVRIAVSLAQQTKDYLIDTLSWLRGHNLTDYQVAEVIFSGRGIEGVAITPEEYYNILIDQFTVLKENFPDEINPPVRKPEGGCGIGQSMIYIKADGTILPCHGCIKDMGVGNIRNVDLVTFWDENESLETIRSLRAEEDDSCSLCRYLAFCTGCIANAFIREGKIRCYDPYACARLKAYEKVMGLEEGYGFT
jgi:radical SAM protein with 4Fe4S-binding SPASM domain